MQARRRAYVVDLDGTLVDSGERWRLCEERHRPRSPGFWECFLDPGKLWMDRPRGRMVGVVKRAARRGIAIVVLTGRPERMRRATFRQLEGILGFRPDRLVMRPEGDRRRDYEFKEEALRELMRYYQIIAVYDDSERVREAARRLGLQARPPP